MARAHRALTFWKTPVPDNAALEPEPALKLQDLLDTSPNSKKIKDANVAFPHLSNCQFIAEKCNEVLLHLKLNAQILQQLLEYYQNLRTRRDMPAQLVSDTEDDMLEFNTKISSTLTDFKMQQSRVELLVKLLEDRKTLLLSKIEQSQMLTNQELSHRAHDSTRRMERMTESMEAIAKKTERETILVRIITVVTLLFLPATYVSVGFLGSTMHPPRSLLQTLMSTDIVHYQAPDNGGKPVRTFAPEALKLYFWITIPLTLFTILFAFVFRWRANLSVRKRDEQLKKDEEYGEVDLLE